MGDVVKFRKPSLAERAQGKTLCRRGFHQWRIVHARKFDVAKGKLVTLKRCRRCGQEKTELL